MLGLHCLMGFSLVVASRGYPSWQQASPCHGFSCWGVQVLGHKGFISRGPRGSGTEAQRTWHTDLAALQHVESSRTRDQTRVSCIGRQILYHWATRETPAQDSLASIFLRKHQGVQSGERAPDFLGWTRESQTEGNMVEINWSNFLKS